MIQRQGADPAEESLREGGRPGKVGERLREKGRKEGEEKEDLCQMRGESMYTCICVLLSNNAILCLIANILTHF